MDFEGRIVRLRKTLAEHDVGALLVSNLTNIRYLCGFTGSNGHLLLAERGAWFFTDGRYRTQSAEEVSGADVVVYKLVEEAGETVATVARSVGEGPIGFESQHASVAEAEKYKSWFPGFELTGVGGAVEALRRVKEPAEIEAISRAAELADQGFAWVIDQVQPGRSEKEIALDLEFFLRRNGAEDVSFDIIVAAAERSALPHAHPTAREVLKGRFLLFDFGCRVDGYCSDLTRTVMVGPADGRHEEIYEIVARAQVAGLDAVRSGVIGGDVDSAARTVIDRAGYADAFGHGLGHGVGLDIHEAPGLRPPSRDILAPNEVVTVEPGIYLADLGGVRIEDLLVVKEGGNEVLSKAPKDLIVL